MSLYLQFIKTNSVERIFRKVTEDVSWWIQRNASLRIDASPHPNTTVRFFRFISTFGKVVAASLIPLFTDGTHFVNVSFEPKAPLNSLSQLRWE